MGNRNTSQGFVDPVRRIDLQDYFRIASKFYPGYVKQAVFRSKMKLVVDYAWLVSRKSEMPQSIMDGQLSKTGENSIPISLNYDMIVKDNSFRKNILMGVEAMDWRPENLMKNMVAELKKKSSQHFSAAAVDPVLTYAGGKLVEKRIMPFMTKKIETVAKSDKVNAKLGKAMQYAVKDFEYHKVEFKVYKKDLSFNMIEGNVAGLAVGKAVDGLSGYGVDKLTDLGALEYIKPAGVNASLNNENTRGALLKMGMSEGAANVTMETVDIISDFFPVVSATKMVEDMIANLYLGFRYWNDARKAEETQKFFDKKWNELIANLKIYIKQDINSLKDNELIQLQKCLENK